jgi:hypothetical protein
MKGVLLCLVRWARRAGTRYFFLSYLGYFNRPSTKYFFPRHTLFYFICPPHRPASWAGSRAARPSINMCRWALYSDTNSVDGSGTEKGLIAV